MESIDQFEKRGEASGNANSTSADKKLVLGNKFVEKVFGLFRCIKNVKLEIVGVIPILYEKSCSACRAGSNEI